MDLVVKSTIKEEIHLSLLKYLKLKEIDHSLNLIELGVDSLVLMRILADSVADTSIEIDPDDLVKLETLEDLNNFITRLNEPS